MILSLRPPEGFIPVPGGRVWYRIDGTDAPGVPLLVLHGGPGSGHEYLEPLADLGADRPVIFYDQLGCGESDRPDDPSLWTVQRFLQELDAVRSTLALTDLHLFGHSWGSMLAADHVLTGGTGIRSLILAGPALSVPRWRADAERLIGLLPTEICECIRHAEASGNFDADDYREAMGVFSDHFLCRIKLPPKKKQVFGRQVYRTMWGPSEFHVRGSLREYDRMPDLPRIAVPTLLTCGRFDEATPEATAEYCRLIPGARMEVFESSAHLPQIEERGKYMKVVGEFLKEVDKI